MAIKLSAGTTFKLHTLASREFKLANWRAKEEVALGVIKSQHEARYVAHLCRAISIIAKRWDAALIECESGYRLGLASVFTHQTPCVNWAVPGEKNKRCELADLLVAIVDRSGPSFRGTAALFQVKLPKPWSLRFSTESEKTQFELLSTRPVFNVEPSGAPTGIDLRSMSPDSALMYASPWLPHKFGDWIISDDLRRAAKNRACRYTASFSGALVGLLLGAVGWDFDSAAKAGNQTASSTVNPCDHWSLLINHLMDKTFGEDLRPALVSSAGRSTRGYEDTIGLVSATSGQKMMFHMLQNSKAPSIIRGFGQGRESERIDWRPFDAAEGIPIEIGESGDGGDGSEDGRNGSDMTPEGGPISAVLIEISRSEG